ncbi:phospholipase D-like domain-containing protein [[Eubacterium] cellulosolvens]
MRRTILIVFMVTIILFFSSCNLAGSIFDTGSSVTYPNNLTSRSAQTIVINEFMPDPDSDWDGDMVVDSQGDEWVELYNYGTQSLDISGWDISDYYNKRYEFPPGTIIPPGGYYVAYGSNHSLALTNSGDTVKLLNSSDAVIDSFCYELSYDDISFGRLPDGSGNWTEFNEPSPGSSNGVIPKIVFNEVMYNPAGSDKTNEWLELYNNDTKVINITSWRITDQDGLVDYIFKSEEYSYMLFPPQTYLILHASSGDDELEFSDGIGNLYMSLPSAMLDNSGDDILFTDRGFLCIDYVAYGKGTMIDPPPHPGAWDGTWYDTVGDVYFDDRPNPEADFDCTIRLNLNGQDNNSALGWGNASDLEITQGRNNNEILGLELTSDSTIKYINTSQDAIYNISITNPGNIPLNLQLTISPASDPWEILLSDSTLKLNPRKTTNITLLITAPQDISMGNQLDTNITVTALEYNLSETITVSTIIPAVDLTPAYLLLNGESYLNEFFQGEIVQLKAKISNLGILDGSAFDVEFYYNEVDPKHLLGVKNYDYIYAKGYKYPSVYWDTLAFQGNYTIIVLVDPDNRIVEPNENNNRLEYNISVIDTTPSQFERQLLITEVYYDTKLSYDPDEFVYIFNPTNKNINISGWQLTNNLADDLDDSIRLPEDTWLPPNRGIYITDDAEAFKFEVGFEPDFACQLGKVKNAKLLLNFNSWPGLSNNGNLVILRDDYRHIIDLVCYGTADSTSCPTHWHGQSVPAVPEGKLLKRQRVSNAKKGSDGQFQDTDCAMDWQAPRLYGIGQSDFQPRTIAFSGEVIPFVSPENSFTIINSELGNASNYIYLNVYEFTHQLLGEKLIEALGRGVKVRILLEGNPLGWNFSNLDEPTAEKAEEYSQKYILNQLYHEGAEIKFLSNIKNDHKNNDIFKRYKYNHAKYSVIDGEKTIIFSGNWKPTSVPGDPTYGNREWGLVIYNRTVAEYFEKVFDSDWWPSSEFQNDTHYFEPASKVYGAPPNFFNFNYTNSTNWYEPLKNGSIYPESRPIKSDFIVEPVLSPDTSARPDTGILGLIGNAEESIFIQQMDLALDWVLTRISSKQLSFNWSDPQHYYLNWADGNNYYNEYLTAVIAAARRGVEVKLLLDSRYVELDVGPGEVSNNSEVDNLDTIQYINNLAALEGLTNTLEARLSYLSGLEKIHNKGMIVDGRKVLISSINWNYNSISYNREAGVVVENTQVAGYYQNFFDYDWSRSIANSVPNLPNASERAVLITEFYADTYVSYEPDEYVCIANPTNDVIDITGWLITDKLTDYAGYEGDLIFPAGSVLKPQGKIYITRSAQAFYDVHNFLPDFEFFEDSRMEVPQLEILDPSTGSSRGPRFANKGDEIVLADEYLFSDLGLEHEHIIDMVVFGNSTFISDWINISYPFNATHWLGPSVYNITHGEVLKRNRVEELVQQPKQLPKFLDSNSAFDWETNRVYKPGQSDFSFDTIEYTGSVTVFSSPDSSYEVISNELNKAQISIYLSVYQFHNPYLMDDLINASLRGIDVKVLLDGAPVGGLTDAARFVAQQLDQNGCEVRFMSAAADDIQRRYRFIHTKYVVIDNFTTIVMSENWKTSGVPIDNTAGNRGWGIVLRNAESAGEYVQVFFHDWNPNMGDSIGYNTTNQKFGAPPEDFVMSWAVFGGDYGPRFPSRTINGQFKVTPVVAPDTTLDHYDSILDMISSATTSVFIEQLDCYIDWDTKDRKIPNLYLQAAIAAARRGCDVRFLLDSAFASPDDPGLDNYDTVKYINSIAQAENLTHNLQAKLIHLTGWAGKNQLEKVHNKGIIVDGNKTLVSSINWATGSVLYNREAGVIIENEQVAKFFTEIFFYDWNLTVHELINGYVLYSDTRDIQPGDSTEYTISFVNTEPEQLSINLSLTGLMPGWNASFDIMQFKLDSSAQNVSGPMEVRLTVNAPTREYLNEHIDYVNLQSNDTPILTLELGVNVETKGMAADIFFTKTNLMLDTEPKDKDSTGSETVLDRSMIDPWVVVVLLAIVLIIGAVLRDLVRAKLDNKKAKSSTKKKGPKRRKLASDEKVYMDEEE